MRQTDSEPISMNFQQKGTGHIYKRKNQFENLTRFSVLVNWFLLAFFLRLFPIRSIGLPLARRYDVVFVMVDFVRTFFLLH